MEKILVVDDEAGVIEVIKEAFLDEDYEIISTTDSKEAKELIQNNDFNLIITDLKMPNIDGLEITKVAKEVNSKTDVVVVTGYASIESAVESLKSNIYDYILKPFQVSEIKITVNKVFEKQRLARTNAKLNEQVKKVLNDITTLYEISRITNSTDSLEETLSFAAETISASIGVEEFLILLEAEDSKFEVKKAVGIDQDSFENFYFKLKNGHIGKQVKGDEYTIIHELDKDEIFKESIPDEKRKNIDNIVVLPLNAEDKFFGALSIFNMNEENEEEKAKLDLLQIIAVQIAPIIKLNLNKIEHEKVLLDPLYPARLSMKNIVQKALDYQGSLGILIFKLYLKKGERRELDILDVDEKIFARMSEKVREIDSVIKMGIDSFVSILQGKSKVAMEIFADEVKKEVETEILQEINPNLSLDYGYSTFPDDGTTFEELISKAQENLWNAVKKS